MTDHQLHVGPQGIPHAPHSHPFEGDQHAHRKAVEAGAEGHYSHLENLTGNLSLVNKPDKPTATAYTVEVGNTGNSNNDDRQREFLHGRKLAFAFIGWLLTEFMGGLGGNMLGPALPVVASQFNALDKLGWVGGAFYMTQCACMLLFGQCLAVFNSKYVLILSVVFFMVGSAISGAAMNVEALIIGRAFAGIGAAGCWVCVQTLVAMLVALETRPFLLGLFGFQNALSGTVGPILAGALTNAGQWRWCFLIVLPLGAFTILVNFFALPSLPPWPLEDDINDRLDRRLRIVGQTKPVESIVVRRILLVDWIGYFIITASLICFILALQWGGTEYPWKSGIIIGLFIGFGLIMALGVFWETKAPWPLMPTKAFRNRTVVGASIMSLFTLFCNLLFAIFGPLLYEAGRDATPLQAGILVIPFILTVVLSQGVEGFIMSYTKHYWHWGWSSPAFLAIGGGLLFTVNINTTSAQLIGYQIIYGLGIGFTQNVAYLSVQADNEPKDVPAAIAIVSFTQLFGGMCGPVVASAIVNSGLRQYLPQYGVDEKTAMSVIRSVGAVWELEGEIKTRVIMAYLRALNNVYIAAVPVSVVVIMAALLIRNVSLKAR